MHCAEREEAGGEPKAGSARGAGAAAPVKGLASIGNVGVNPEVDLGVRRPGSSASERVAAMVLAGNKCILLVFKITLLRSGGLVWLVCG